MTMMTTMTTNASFLITIIFLVYSRKMHYSDNVPNISRMEVESESCLHGSISNDFQWTWPYIMAMNMLIFRYSDFNLEHYRQRCFRRQPRTSKILCTL